jgi:hypothetical protein
MTLNQRFSVVALLLLGLNAQAKTDAAFLEAVAAVESGHNRKAIGKAGDAMAEDLLKEFGHKEMLKYQPYQDWNAAKEGKQS